MSKVIKSFLFFAVIIATIIQQACTSGNQQKNQFELLNSETTGLSFSNSPVPTLYLNAFNFMYFYNGGGLAVGDFNNDGLQDVFFTANMEANKMFLNEGNFTFTRMVRHIHLCRIAICDLVESQCDIYSDMTLLSVTLA